MLKRYWPQGVWWRWLSVDHPHGVGHYGNHSKHQRPFSLCSGWLILPCGMEKWRGGSHRQLNVPHVLKVTTFAHICSTIIRFPDNWDLWFQWFLLLKIGNSKCHNFPTYFNEDHWKEISWQVSKLLPVICRGRSILNSDSYWVVY